MKVTPPTIFWRNGSFRDECLFVTDPHSPETAAIDSVRILAAHDRSLWILEPIAHLQRLARSARILGFELDMTLDEILSVLKAIRDKVSGDYYVKITARADSLMIVAEPSVLDYRLTHVHLKTSREPRGYPNSDLTAKSMSNLRDPNTLTVDNQGYVTGTGQANLVLLRDGVMYLPQSPGSVLDGISLRILTQVIASRPFNDTLAIPMLSKPMTLSDLQIADEAFIISTKSGIQAIRTITDQGIGLGNNTQTLLINDLYHSVIRRKLSDKQIRFI